MCSASQKRPSSANAQNDNCAPAVGLAVSGQTSRSPYAVSRASTMASSGPPGQCLMTAAAKDADIKKILQLASHLVCQLKQSLNVSTFRTCSHQAMTSHQAKPREPKAAVVERLLTASGDVQHAASMLQRGHRRLAMTACCISSALAKTLGSMRTVRMRLLEWHYCPQFNKPKDKLLVRR